MGVIREERGKREVLISVTKLSNDQEGIRTSPPLTFPVFFTSNDTSNAGRWSQSAVEPPATFGEAAPLAHAASSFADVLSAWWIARTCRLE